MKSEEYQVMRFSGVYLSKKINKLINMGMMHTEEDLIHLTGVVFLFEIPMCAN